MTMCSRAESAEGNLAMIVIRGVPLACGPSQCTPDGERSRKVSDAFLPSASIIGETSASCSSYGQVHVLIAPFFIASSGSPAPTFHSCTALEITESPACRAPSTSSIHVFSVARVEIMIDLGRSAISGTTASSAGVAVPSRRWLATIT